jgi:hypothetical protein
MLISYYKYHSTIVHKADKCNGPGGSAWNADRSSIGGEAVSRTPRPTVSADVARNQRPPNEDQAVDGDQYA